MAKPMQLVKDQSHKPSSFTRHSQRLVHKNINMELKSIQHTQSCIFQYTSLLCMIQSNHTKATVATQLVMHIEFLPCIMALYFTHLLHACVHYLQLYVHSWERQLIARQLSVAIHCREHACNSDTYMYMAAAGNSIFLIMIG